MKIRELEDIPSSSGVSDGDDDEVSIDGYSAISSEHQNTFIYRKEPFSLSFEQQTYFGDSKRFGAEPKHGEEEVEKFPSGTEKPLKNLVTNISGDNHCPTDLERQWKTEEYVNSLNLSNPCVSNDANLTTNKPLTQSKSTLVHTSTRSADKKELAATMGNQNTKDEQLNVIDDPTVAALSKDNNNHKKYYDSSDESEDCCHPSDENYEGSEENEDDDCSSSSSKMFDKSRFKHYQKLLKEHQFQEGGDEEQYLRFLYHRHLYYNELQKISPKSIKLFRRLEGMQHGRHGSRKASKSSNYYGEDLEDLEQKYSRAVNRRERHDAESRSLSEMKYSIPRLRPLAKLSSSQSLMRRSKSPHHRAKDRQKSRSSCSNSSFTHLENFLTIPFILLVFLSFLLAVESVAGCKLSEFACANYECIKADAYCDGEADCTDRSDEPRDCTPCNKTFYGDVGKKYEVSVKKPKDLLTTFTCHLTFIAGGASYGDLVQLNFQEFSLGDFFSYNSGCPQGWMQISERDRPYSEGYWCGDGKGFNIYYSETSTVTLTLKQFIPMEYIHFENLFKAPFKFRLSYKTLNHEHAVLRYGRLPNAKYRGDLVPGSLCNRYFLNCDEHYCAVQSPNYPGMYPRHITCHYVLRQTRYVPYSRPLISILQRNKLKFNVKDRSALPSQGIFPPGLQVWGACDLVHDFLMIYDGNSTDAPLLLKVCGSGELPPVTSTGAEMLVVFTTSRFDEPTSESFMTKKMGFEMDVKVNYLDMDSREFARNRQCVFHIFSTNNRTGDVTSVINTQPPNSTCVYLFHGEPHEVVWVHFKKYEVLPKLGHYKVNLTECINPLLIYEGNLYDTRLPYGAPQKIKKLGEHCTTKHPPMCAREYLPHRSGLASYVKACTRNESYVANGHEMTVVQFYNESTAALGMDFILHYEFVNTRPGYRASNDSKCDQEAISDGYSHRTGRFFSPTTSVLYGRWGKTQMKCQYRLLAASDEVVRITITTFRTASRSCYTTRNNFTGGYDCEAHGRRYATLTISEYPWNDIEVPRMCTCDSKALPIRYESRSRELRLIFNVHNMDNTHDYTDFMFDAQYEFIKKVSCKKEQRLQGTSGEIIFHNKNMSINRPCASYPWLLQTSDAKKSVYFRIRGYDHLDRNCTSATRLLVFKVGRLRPVAVLCPDPNSKNVVELFSFAWRGSGALEEQSTDKLVLELSSMDSKLSYPQVGPHILHWLQVSPARQYDWAAEGIVRGCKQECPELGVCISEELWCDGVHHCPSGHDELIAHCFFQSVPWAYVGVGSTMIATFVVSIIIYGGAKLRSATKKKTRTQTIPTLPTASESLFSSDKDVVERDGHVSSTYSLDYSEMDYVTTL